MYQQRCNYLGLIRDKKSAFFREVRLKMALNKVKKNLIKCFRYKKN